MSYRQLSLEAGLNENAVSELIKRNEKANPTLNTILSLSKILGIDVFAPDYELLCEITLSLLKHKGKLSDKDFVTILLKTYEEQSLLKISDNKEEQTDIKDSIVNNVISINSIKK